MAYTTRDLLTESYRDIQVLAVGETLSAEQAADGLLKLTRLLDNWNAERAGVYANRIISDTMTPGLNPQTIGPASSTPVITVTQRPVSIEWANIIITDGVRVPLSPMGSLRWASLTVPALETSIPSSWHYEPEWPVGKLYLYPVPDTAYEIELLTRIVLADLALDDVVSFPPGYRDAIILTHGEMVALTYPPAVPSPDAAAKARARIFANNDEIPPLITRDSGVPYAGQNRGRWFDWMSGQFRP